MTDIDNQIKRAEEDTFEIDSDAKADWALEKIKELKNEIDNIEETAQERIDQIKSWRDNEVEKIKNNIEYFEQQLEVYMKKLRDVDPDLKTKNLPFGKLKFRKQRPKWKYDDEKLTEYAKENCPSVIKVKEKVNKRELKKKCEIVDGKVVNTETGEIVEGVEIEERGEKFRLKVK